MLEVNVFKPNSGDLLPKTQFNPDMQARCGQTDPNSPQFGLVGTYLPDLKQKCKGYIEDIVSRFAHTMQVAAAGNSALSWKVFEAVRKFHQRNPV